MGSLATTPRSPLASDLNSVVAAADINGDGWPDLICANAYDDTLSVFTNNGSGGFVPSATLSTPTMEARITLRRRI